MKFKPPEIPPRLKAKLVGLMGVTAVGLIGATAKFEGYAPVGYRDPVSIPTACYGHTGDIVVGRDYSGQCGALFGQDMIEAAEGALKCVPQLEGHDEALAASTDFVFNVGASKFCSSSMAKAFRAGDFKTGCERFNESAAGLPQWVYAGNRQLPGLVRRRAYWRNVCERGNSE